MTRQQIYQEFNPFQPLRPSPAGEKNALYVDLVSVRGDSNILQDIGQKILLSKGQNTCQLYTGHRGGGKSTELLRLQQYLRQEGIYVVYFDVLDSIQTEDTEYTDILLACTASLLQDLQAFAKPDPLLHWLNDRWDSLKDLLLTDITFDNLKIDVQISQFAKMSASLRQLPSARQELRRRLDAHTPNLLVAINEFVTEAKQDLQQKSYQDLAILVDNLERITLVQTSNNSNNYEEIFINRSEQIKGLECHVVYTVPLSLVFSDKAAELESIYGKPQILPMVAVKMPKSDAINPDGIAKLIEIIRRRLQQVDESLANTLTTSFFSSEETLQVLCFMTGGDVRQLMQFVQKSLERTETFPIADRAVKRAISETRDTYRNTIKPQEYTILAKVFQTKEKPNDEASQLLLLNRCIMEYCAETEEGEVLRWFDVHPTILGIEEFKRAQENLGQEI